MIWESLLSWNHMQNKLLDYANGLQRRWQKRTIFQKQWIKPENYDSIRRMDQLRIDDMTTTNQNTPNICAYFVGYTVRVSRCYSKQVYTPTLIIVTW